jgi:hypothetical protein
MSILRRIWQDPEAMKVARLITFALIALLLAAPVTSGMLVLCFGSDGHVAVESASANLCCREWENAHRETPDEDLLTTIEPVSGPCCDDVDLSVESAALTVPTQKVIPASALPCSVPVLALPPHTASVGTFPLWTESPVAESLRTVILRA